MNKKLFEILSIILIQLVITMPFFAIDVNALSISNVQVSNIQQTSAMIEWETDVAASSKVDFGDDQSLGDSVGQSSLVTSHEITLSDVLESNKRYFFSVESTDLDSNTVLDDNSGNLYTFTTIRTTGGDDSSTPTPRPSDNNNGLRTLDNLNVPRYYNKRVIDIAGLTEPNSEVLLFVNDLSNPVKTLDSSQVGNSGRFQFRQVQLDDENTVRIRSISSSGTNENTFQITVDTIVPAATLNYLPNLTSNSSLMVSGTVDEEVTLQVFSKEESSSNIFPAKITGLKSNSVTANSIEIEWDQLDDIDFDNYVVYRGDVGPIARTNPGTYNLYIDSLVDSGQSYTYEVTAVNTFGNEGPKSDELTVRTLSGGQDLGITPESISSSQNHDSPIFTQTVSTDFEFPLAFGNSDGDHVLTFVFEDLAKNRIEIKKRITLDTVRPAVRITSPRSGALIYENAAGSIDITGITKPFAKVHLFIERNPLDLFEQRVPGAVQVIPGAQSIGQVSNDRLGQLCLEGAVQNEACNDKADKITTADGNGEYRFNDVNLDAAFGVRASLTQVPVTEIRDITLNREQRDRRETTITVIAVDRLNQRGFAQQTVGIGTCWSGNQSWDIIPISEQQAPSLLSSERLAEGTETLYFFFNYSYIGRGSNARVRNVFLSKACGSSDLLDSRFNRSCLIMPAGDSPTQLNPEGTLTYSAMTLGRYDGMERYLRNDWRSFFDSLGIGRDMTFPMKVRIIYEHDIIDGNGQLRTVQETQTACQEVSYVVDDTLLFNPASLPDFILYDFVDGLEKSIEALTRVQDAIDRASEFVGWGCIVSFFGTMALKIQRNIIELTTEALENPLLNSFSLNSNSPDAEYCNSLTDAIKNDYGEFKLKYVSDPDLKKCFKRVYDVWQREQDVYTARRWSCDRIFGHDSPSRWTETKSDTDLYKKLDSKETCAGDGAEKGQPLRAVECSLIAPKYSKIFFKDEGQPLGKKCFEIQSEISRPNDLFVWALDEEQDSRLISENIYRLEPWEERPSRRSIYAKKLNDDLFLTYQPQTCNEACGFRGHTQKNPITVDGSPYSMEQGRSSILSPGIVQRSSVDDGIANVAGCVTATACREWYQRGQPNQEGIKLGETTIKNYRVESKGYTSDCFYEDGDNSDVISDTNPKTRETCCCINGQLGESDYYYQPDDEDLNLESIAAQMVHESKTVPNSPPRAQTGDGEGFSDMKYSYRYSKIGYLNKKYNPNRYIEGRDKPACFGQDHLFLSAFGQNKEDVIMLNPFQQDTAALQCAYLTGVSQRLQLYKNIMASMSSCLIESRTNSIMDGAICKELFTQHVCGSIWQIIRFFVDGCSTNDPDFSVQGQEERAESSIRLGLTGISRAMSDAQTEFSEDYGNAKVDNLFGVGQGGVARKMCLLAFGYDWDINANNLLDVAYASPFRSLVQPTTSSREFLTIDPVTLRPKIEYRTSWIVNPGCEMEGYKVELACVSRYERDRYPNKVDCGQVGSGSLLNTGAFQGSLGDTTPAYRNCDCLSLNGEQTQVLFSDTRLAQNQFREESIHRVVESNYRYDHLKFTLRPNVRIPTDIRQNCFPQGYEDGVFYFPLYDKTPTDIFECSVDPLTGTYSCGSQSDFFSDRGIAQLLEVSINGENPNNYRQDELEFEIGEPLRVGGTVTNTGRDKCFRVSLYPDPIEPQYDIISIDGLSEIAPIQIVNQLSVSSGRTRIQTIDVNARIITQQNHGDVTIDVEFIDNVNINSIPNSNSPIQSRAPNTPGNRYSIDDEAIIEGIRFQNLAGRQEVPFQDGFIEVNDGIIIIEKNDPFNGRVEIEISDVNYRELQNGLYGASETIRVTGSSSARGEDYSYRQNNRDRSGYPREDSDYINDYERQRKTVTVGIYNLRGEGDAFSGEGSCNLNDKIVEKSYEFIVSRNGRNVRDSPPRIERPRINKEVQVIGQNLELSTKITHSSGIEFARVAVTGPYGEETTRNMNRRGDIYEAVYQTGGKRPGDYIGEIYAKSNAGPDFVLEFEFELVPPAN